MREYPKGFKEHHARHGKSLIMARFDDATFAALVQLAKKNRVSVAEQIRVLVADGIASGRFHAA